MKYLLLLGFVGLVTSMAAQPVKKTVTLQVFKENKRIDSLLDLLPDSLSKNATLSVTITTLHPGWNEWRFYIQHFKSDGGLVYYPSADSSRVDDFGYFKYKGHRVLLSGLKEDSVFFKPTTSTKSLVLVWDNALYYQDLLSYYHVDYAFIGKTNRFKIDYHMYH